MFVFEAEVDVELSFKSVQKKSGTFFRHEVTALFAHFTFQFFQSLTLFHETNLYLGDWYGFRMRMLFVYMRNNSFYLDNIFSEHIFICVCWTMAIIDNLQTI